GGSAQVTRSLAHILPQQGWDITVVSSSLQVPGLPGDAHTFFEGLDLYPLDCTAALDAADPLLANPPLPPSYEDRPGAPDRVFAAVDDATYAHLVDVWARGLQKAGAAEATILHLHHLTPLNAAAARVAPHVPVVGHLHGTELLMLERIAHGPPTGWVHANAWADRMRSWAAACQVLIVPSASLVVRAQALLGIPAERCIHVPNGFNPQQFDRRTGDRQALWQDLLVEYPQGWRPGDIPGSVAYTADQVHALATATVLLYVGRFTALKRLDVLLRVYVRASSAFTAPAALVMLGGFPGEWEGQHPFELIQDLGAQNVFLAGWHDQADLPAIFAAADAVVLASAQEPFGQVLVESMACGLPAIAIAAGGPREIITDGQTGWLVPPNDEAAFAAALVSAVNDADTRRARGAAAYDAVHARYSWPALGAYVARIYEQVLKTRTS
ncbi:MAG TPA: glycosyltransferase family 4 protein, partial [Ktedonobacteraceae bacterium]|nr:glycosyltransferase family 4 protein [Ktedonobacteraceae bacterium]